MSNLNPTVFVVDRDAAVRASLENVIRGAGWMPATFPTATEFLAKTRLPNPSCLFMELDYSEQASFDLLRHVAIRGNGMPFIVMSSQPDIPLTVRAMKAGALEFLLKPLSDDAILVAAGYGISRSQAQLQRESLTLELRNRYSTLSEREREVMSWVVAGLLNKQVGAELGISEITVKAHRGRVMRKMGADSLAELVSMSLRLELPAVRSSLVSRFKPRSDFFARETGVLAEVG